MYLQIIADLKEWINDLEKYYQNLPQFVSLVQLVKSVELCHMMEYTFLCVMKHAKQSVEHIGIVATCENRIRTEYHLFYHDKLSRPMMDMLLSMVDWTKCNRFYAVPINRLQALTEVAKQHGVTLESDIRYSSAILKTKEALPDVCHVDGVVVVKLTEDKASIINSHWDFKYEYSESKIRRNLVHGVGYGVFVDGKLVSWALLNHLGKIGHLYTLPEFRRQGYASMVVNTLSRHLLKLSITPIADIGDVAGETLFCKKLGFEKTLDSATITYGPC